jgi:dihydrodipicolinate synthase/N-acetylneuraminate lyase
VYEASLAGRAEEARTLAERGSRLINAISGGGPIAAIKFVLQKQGLAAGDPRKPFLSLTGEQREQIEQALADMPLD